MNPEEIKNFELGLIAAQQPLAPQIAHAIDEDFFDLWEPIESEPIYKPGVDMLLSILAMPFDESKVLRWEPDPNIFETRAGDERQWKYDDGESPTDARCFDCRIPYAQMSDLSLPHEIWEKINPTNYEGSGVLCPNCICERLHQLNIQAVEAKIYG
jgi:hypothetical protein